jgi:L-threonylcarbamoyladenylate synthase
VEIIPNTREGVERAAWYIRSGGLVAWPSPMWYGFSANALDPDAIGRLYAAKRRPLSEALILTTLGVADAERYGELNPVARRLATAYWPGYLGIVVKKRPDMVPDIVTSGRDTVLLVCLDGLGHELPRLAGVPMVASSANVSGTGPALTFEEVRGFSERAGAPIDAAMEGPVSPFNQPTTSVDTTVTPPAIFRLGIVHEESIRRVLPDAMVAGGRHRT